MFTTNILNLAYKVPSTCTRSRCPSIVLKMFAGDRTSKASAFCLSCSKCRFRGVDRTFRGVGGGSPTQVRTMNSGVSKQNCGLCSFGYPDVVCRGNCF